MLADFLLFTDANVLLTLSKVKLIYLTFSLKLMTTL